jgi:hypothetical protein
MKCFKTFVLFVTVLFLGSFLAGCTSSAKRTGYLHDYAKLEKGKYLENYWSNTPRMGKTRYSTIRVEAIAIDRIQDQEGVTAEDCRGWLRNALVEGTRVLGDHFVFEAGLDEAEARLEIAITEMTPGSATGRKLAGEFGMGHAWVQVEGRIVDIESNEEVVAFSDRRRSSGAIGLKDIGGDAGPSLVHEMLDQIATDIIQERTESFAFRQDSSVVENGLKD